VAAEPGFEPGLEDPKSTVLPLHNSAIEADYNVYKGLCQRISANHLDTGKPFTTFNSKHNSERARRVFNSGIA
jgi:hypothetical protein